MARTRRRIRAGRPHEIILRVKEGLPFATLLLMNTLLKSIIARVQRDGKVVLCHMVWMGNHVHLFVVPYDTEACIFFYQEIQKKITETVKRLRGVHRLSLWEGDPVVAEVLDCEAAIDRIAYIYANPAQANLVDTISEYPGYSTYSAFSSIQPQLGAGVSERVPWIQLPFITKLRKFSLSHNEDESMAMSLIEKAKKSHELTYYPNAWMKAFKITEENEIARVNRRIMERLQAREEDARALRKKNGKGVLGVRGLMGQTMLKKHTPSRRERRVYVFSTIPELRIAYINAMRRFCERCRECYRLLRDGVSTVRWPPGAVRPWVRPMATAI